MEKYFFLCYKWMMDEEKKKSICLKTQEAKLLHG